MSGASSDDDFLFFQDFPCLFCVSDTKNKSGTLLFPGLESSPSSNCEGSVDHVQVVVGAEFAPKFEECFLSPVFWAPSAVRWVRVVEGDPVYLKLDPLEVESDVEIADRAVT